MRPIISRACIRQLSVSIFFLLSCPFLLAQEELGDSAYLPVHDAPPPVERYNGEFSISPQLGDLQDYLQINLLIQGDCPTEEYVKVSSAIAKDFDLLAASFIRAELEALANWQLKMGMKNGSCTKSKDRMWQFCQGSDDLVYTTQSQKIHQQLMENHDVIEVDREAQELLLNEVNKTPWGRRLFGKDSSHLQRKDVSKVIEQVCEDNLSLINRLCKSQYSVYGLSEIPWVEEELNNFYKVLGDRYHSLKQCLPRYVWENKKYEQNLPSLLLLMKSWGPWLEGNRFPLGPLMGLKALLILQQQGKVTYEAEKEIAAKEEEKKVVLTPIIRPTPTAKGQALALVVPTPTVQNADHGSAFDQAYSLFQVKEMKEEVKVSTTQFRLDYPQLYKRAMELEEFLTPFQSQNALQKLKDQDGVGSEKTPMLLSFLKLFIDRNRHRVIFNLQSVLGNEFYIENDLGETPYTVKIRLDFNQAEGWTITIIPPQSKL